MMQIKHDITHSFAYAELDDLGFLFVEGPDAENFLQGRTTNDVKSLTINKGQESFFLDRKGYLVANCSLHRFSEQKYLIVSEQAQLQTILSELKKYHFRENLKYFRTESYRCCYFLAGEKISAFLVESFLTDLFCENDYDLSLGQFANLNSFLIKIPRLDFDSFYLFIESDELQILEKYLQEKSLFNSWQKLDNNDLEVLRIESGIPRFGKDMGQEHLLPETALEQRTVSYDKGCFQGQEVLARIKTYGAPKQALVGLEFHNSPEHNFDLNTAFYVNNEIAGNIRSNIFSSKFEKFIALAYINREFRIPHNNLKIRINNNEFDVTVRFLPFHLQENKKDKALLFYEQALKEYLSNNNIESAIDLLKRSIELNPFFADAYEILGVILSKANKYDEAIALMYKLASLVPDSIMAHTNLSIFYMEIGDKERAEEEKAISMSMSMSLIAKQMVHEKELESQKKEQEKETLARMEMFQQVLAIDSNDFLANYGLGAIYLDLNKFHEAIPLLQKCLEMNKTYTNAYLALARSYQALLNYTESLKVLRTGIEVAAKRGDMTPLKEMQVLESEIRKISG